MADATRDASADNDVMGKAFLVTKPIRLDQLAYEVNEAMNWRKEPVFSAAGDADHASVESPVIVYCDRDDVDDNTFISAVTAHSFDSAWVHPNLPTTTPPPPPQISLDDLYTKVENGVGLTVDEQSAAIAGLLTEWHNRTTA